MRFRSAVLAALMATFGWSTAQAQAEVMVGLGAISFVSSDGESGTIIGVNNQTVRLGLPLTPSVMLEPAISVLHISGEGSSATTLGVGALLPIYFGGSHTGVYIAPGAGVTHTSFDFDLLPDDNFSSSQVAIFGELGNRSRISEQVSLRLAANVRLDLENDDSPSQTTISGIVGLSVRIK